MGHALDLHPRAAAAADVDIGPGGADPGAHLTGAPVEEADIVGPFFHFVRIDKVWIGYRLDQGHAEAVGAEYPHVTDVGDLTAGIFFKAQLDQADGPVSATEADM